MSGSEVPIEWGGRRLKAWLPDPLERRPTAELNTSTIRLTERAARAVVSVGDRHWIGSTKCRVRWSDGVRWL